jgi:hypothetical protein
MSAFAQKAPPRRIDLVQLLEQEIVPRLDPDAIFTHTAHHWQKTPSRWRGGCPWHQSSSGTSFYVYPDTKRWRCPQCDIGGGPVQYLHRIRGGHGPARGKDFIALVKELAQRVGVTVPDIELTPDQLERFRRRETRRSILEVVLACCQRLL